MSNKNISIIIPSYNYGHYVKRAVDSVMQQLPENCELIVIDDGSTDNTQEVLAALKMQYPHHFQYVTQVNQGLAATRNNGAAIAMGDYLLFLDADDELLPNALAIIIQYIQKYSNIDYFIARHKTIFENGKVRESKAITLSQDKQKNFVDYLLKKKISIANGALLIKRSVFSKIKYPAQLRAGEDVPTNAKLMALCDGMVIDKCVLQVHRHANSMRYDVDNYSESVKQVADLIFDAQLPSSLQVYKKKYETHKLLSLFRSLYIAQRYPEARKTFLKAFQKDYTIIFQLSYVRKFLKSFLC